MKFAKCTYRLAWLRPWILFLPLLLSVPPAPAAPLTTLEYRVVGQQLVVSPAAVAVPKGIPGSVLTTVAGDLPPGAFVEATLRGPSFPARRLVAAPNEPLMLPPLNLVGDYSLDAIRLIDPATGAAVLQGSPSSVPVRVFDEVLISRVTSRPLTLDEIQERGIQIDEANYRAVEFEVGFVIDGETVPVRFPVVAPSFRQSTEIIPAAELEERLAEVERINTEISRSVRLPPALEVANLNIELKGINFQAVDEDEQDLELRIPPIPALMVIPGNIGFLNQFFSVMIFTENGSPAGSGLSVRDITAELILPPGPDRVPGTWENPGDDPLRFARVGENGIVQPIQPVVRPGPDGILGTSDDIPRLNPGQVGQAEFLIEGLREGLHVMDLKLRATLDGLAAGSVNITGKAAGSVLVRNPRFSMAFSHPRTVRVGEPYEAYVTVLNTSNTPANLVNVTLNRNNVSGGILESPETVELGTLLPGETAMATFRIRSQRTGSITFSNLTTSDDSLVGRFRLRAGVDERGVALSPDTLLLPDFVDELPPALVLAAQRVLGQALSSSTAGQVPPGVIRVPRPFLLQKAVELAEAGQRVRYGEALGRVLPDLLLDWQGARDFNAGWDQILRTTDAGREWRAALMLAMESTVPDDNAVERLAAAMPDLAGRGERWTVAAISLGGGFGFGLTGAGDQRATLDRSGLGQSAGYPGGAGSAIFAKAEGILRWTFETAVPETFAIGLWQIAVDGTATERRFTVPGVAAGACLSLDTNDPGAGLRMSLDCGSSADATYSAPPTVVQELPPAVLAVRQDPGVLVGRPPKACSSFFTTNEAGELLPIQNYGNVVAVLFSKPMTQSTANVPGAYVLDDGNTAAFVQVQPGGRVALLTLKKPVGALIPRTLSVGNAVTDVRGNAMAGGGAPLESRLIEGINARGRVIRADGSPAADVPVTLTFYDEVETFDGCSDWIRRVSQVRTNAAGEFDFDFILGGIGYTLSATDTSGLSPEAIEIILESTREDAVNRARLEELAASPSVRDTLLAEFAVGALPAAIALAEGLDRALVRDLITVGSPRFGTEAVFALRFRGRGTVTGQILAADGATPVAGAAVNLFPAPDSRELGRGILADADGRFAFFGVPLGTFTVEATSPEGRTRIVAETLDFPGHTRDLEVVLSETITVLTAMRGRVTEPDGSPHAGADVYIGRFTDDGRYVGVVASTRSGPEGYWAVENVPVGTYDPLALSSDGRRRGERRDVQAVAGAATTANISLQARAIVSGRVETSTGLPVPNALVGGGETLVRTDELGRFTLTGVPTGTRRIEAAVERDEAAGIDFPRLGSVQVNVIGGADNFAVVRLTPAGRIIGRVLDTTGQPVPFARVSIPRDNGFLWVQADASGNYEFVGLGLNTYDLSSPAPPTEDPFDAGAAIDALRSGSQDEMLAAIGEAFAAFTGVNNPLLNGDGSVFNPLSWGFVSNVRLQFDGQTVVADIRHLGEGTVSGTVLNGQGVPIGARVRLTGIGPSLTGRPIMMVRGERDSDPALGTFEFPGQALVGDWGLQAASPFFPVVISTSGRTTSLEPDATGVTLQFPAVQETNGSLAGQVFNPDGSPAGADVDVQISFGPDFIIRTDEDGRFATQAGTFLLPAGNYTVTATDPESGGTGRANVTVPAGQTGEVDVRLLGRGEGRVRVVRADGTPGAGASVEIRGGQYPRERFEGTTDADGWVTFPNIFEGTYAASVELVVGLTRLSGRGGFTVPLDGMGERTVTLGGTASLRGTFVATDGVTPVSFANIALGNLAFTATDENGHFEFDDVPLGSFRLVGTDAVTGRTGSVNLTFSTVNEVRTITLVETSLGEVIGYVVNGYGTGYVPNAAVTLRHNDSFFPDRTVTTGPDGAFRFPGTPAGGFLLTARDPVTNVTGNISGVLPPLTPQLSLNVPLPALADLVVRVFEPDGVTPAALASVRVLPDLTVDTDDEGRGRFERLRLDAGIRTIIAESREVGFTRRWAGGRMLLADQGREESLDLVLRGVGQVRGQVFLAGGTPAAGAEVRLRVGTEPVVTPTGNISKPFAGATEIVIADSEGRFTFSNVPAGDFRLTAVFLALAGSVNSTLVTDGATVIEDILLSDSGTVVGRVLRADGFTPAQGTDVLLTYPSLSGLPGRANTLTDANGFFSVQNVPVGAVNGEFFNAAVGGLAFRSFSISENNETLDLGDIFLDEDFPEILAVNPEDTADGIDIFTTVEILFSEPLDPASIFDNGIFLRPAAGGPVVEAEVELLDDEDGFPDSLIRLTPDEPLESEATYEVIVVDGDLRNAVGAIVNRGPRDLVGRSLTALFKSTFTTRDQRPPELLSFTPADEAEQIDPRAVIRLTFDEPIRPDATITLAGPGGPVSGTVSLGVNALVLTFVPEVELPVNATFTATVDNVADIAGNFAEDLPFVSTFATLDTIGPEIAELRLKDDADPIAGAPVTVEVVLTAPDPGARVRYSVDFTPLGTTEPDVLEFTHTLPASGTVVFRAIAIDRFGNEGEVAELPVTVVPNVPPVVTFTRVNPSSGPLSTGSPFSVRVDATDATGIAELRAAAGGAATVPLVVTGDDSITLSGVVPAAAAPTAVTFFASAIDGTGTSSGEQTLVVPVADATPPQLSLATPTEGAVVRPDQPLAVDLTWSDNSGAVTLRATVSVDATGTVEEAVSGTRNTAIPATLSLDLDGAPDDGGSLVLEVTATDAAGNETTVSRNLVLADITPPRIVERIPEADTTGAGVLQTIELRFSKPIDPATAEDAATVLRGTDAVPGSVEQTEPDTVVWTPETPLAFGAEHTVEVASTLLDDTAMPFAGESFVFTVTTAALDSPLDDGDYVETQEIDLRALFENEEDIDGVVLRIGETTTAVFAEAAFSEAFPLPLLADVGFAPETASAAVPFAAYALIGGAGEAAPEGWPGAGARFVAIVAQGTLNLHNLEADSDGDGLPNWYELAIGSDPFVFDSDQDFDGDGLTNLEEFERGTDPNLADTDGDGIPDGIDPSPLTPNTPPVAGADFERTTLSFDGESGYVEAHENLAPLNSFGPGMTLMAWIRAEPGAEGPMEIASRYRPGVSTGFGSTSRWRLFLDEDGQPAFDLQGRIANISFVPSERYVLAGRRDTVANITAPPVDLRDGQWHHVAAVFDRASDRMALYVNGALQNERTDVSDVSSIDSMGTAPFSVGRQYRNVGSNEPRYYFHGHIAEVAVFGRALPQDELRGSFQRQLGGGEDDLRLYWRMDESTGATVTDHSPQPVSGIPGMTSPVAAGDTRPALRREETRMLDAGTLLTFQPGAFDADGDELTYRLTALPANGDLLIDGILQTDTGVDIAADAEWVYEPDAGFTGIDELRFTVSDGLETSAPARLRLIVESTVPVVTAGDLNYTSFQEQPFTFSADDLIGASTATSGNLRVLALHPPANGTVVDNGDGTYTYTPDPGFTGEVTIRYTVGTEFAWNRAQEYQPGTVNGSSEGNPNLDLRGFPVWSLGWINGGGGLESSDPWYRGSVSPMVWREDNQYWAQTSNGFSWIIASDMRHVVNSAANLPVLPVVRWVNEFEEITVDVVGGLEVLWAGAGGPPEGQPSVVEVAIAHERSADGVVTLLFSESVDKPIPEATVGDRAFLPVKLTDIELAPGDALRVTQRTLTDTVITNASNRLFDRSLAIVPSVGAPTGTISIQVEANEPPVARSLLDGYALEFDGSDYVDLGNPEALQITGDQTIEMWLKPADFSQRRNPWAKAYAGEGTMTVEINGTINYFYGINGDNSGSNGVHYQNFNTGLTLPLGEWTHIAVVRDLSNGVLLWYFNGELINEADTLFDQAVAGDLIAYIGRGYVQRYEGEIDEVRVWNVARSPEDIAGSFRSRLTGAEAGLVGYWDFDEGAGDLVFDRSPNNLSGTLGNGSNRPDFVPAFTPFVDAPMAEGNDPARLDLDGTDADGDPLTTFITRWPRHGALYTTADGVTPDASLIEAGDALLFEHTRQAVELPHEILNGLGTVTIEFWARTPLNRTQAVFSGANPSNDNNLLIYYRNADSIDFFTGQGTQTPVSWSLESDPAEWRHYAFVRDFDAQTVEFFLDGVSQGVHETALPVLNIAPGGLWLAQEQDSVGGGWDPNQNFVGSLTEIRIWSQARSAADIAADWNRPLAGNELDLRAYYPVDTEGDTLLDRSGNSFHGLLTSIDGARDASRPLVGASSAPLHGGFPFEAGASDLPILYLPELRHRGFDGVGYRVFDGKVFSGEEIHPVLTQRPPPAPVAVGLNLVVQGGAATFINPFFNDYHPDGVTFTLEDFTQPANGAVTFDGDRFIYDPDPAFAGEDAFTYRLTDGVRVSEPATVFLEVTAPEEIRWINPGGGSFHTAANWSADRVPEADERAVIDLEGTYTVTVNTNHTVGQLFVGAASGTQTLRQTGGTFRVTAGGQFAQNGRFELAGGTFRRDGIVTVVEDFNWTGGQITGTGTLRLEGTTTFSGGTNRRFDGLIENAGVFENTGTADLRFGQTSGLSNTFRNLPGATFTASGGGGLSQWNSSTNRFENEGAVTWAAGSSTNVANVTFVNQSTMAVPDGATLIVSSTLDNTGAITLGTGADLVFRTATHELRAEGSITGPGRIVADSGTTRLYHPFPRLRVSGGTLELFADTVATRLELLTGFLSRGEGVTVTVSDAFVWSGGQIAGTGTLRLEGTTTYAGGTNRRFNGLIENAGVFEVTGTADLRFGQTSGLSNTFRNLPGATFTATGGGGLSQWNGGTHRFENEGTVTWTAGASTTVSNVVFANQSMMAIPDGATLIFSSTLDNSGAVTLGTGTDLVFRTATHELRAEGSITGPGRIVADSGTTRLRHPFPRLRVSGGTLQLFADTVATTLDLFSGTLSRGDDVTLTVTDIFVWSGGQIGGTGTLRLEGTTTYSGGTNRRFDGLIENAGTFAHSATAALGFGQTSGLTNTFRNLPGGTFTVTTGGGFNQWNGGTHRFENEGSFVMETTGGVPFNQVALDNTGSVDTGAGADLILRNVTHRMRPEGEVVGAGRLVADSGTTILEHGFSRVRVSGATLLTPVDVSIAELDLASGFLSRATGVTVTVTDSFNWSGGQISGAATLRLEGTTTYAGGSNRRFDGHIENAGTFAHEATTDLRFGRTSGLSNTFRNLAGATFTITGGGGFAQWSGGTHRFENAGTFIRSPGGSTTLTNVHFQNDGLLVLNGGTLTPNGGFTQNAAGALIQMADGTFGSSAALSLGAGVLTGTGTVTAAFTSAGTLRPDPAPGGLTFTGNLTQTAAGRTELSLGPRHETAGHQSLSVGGTFAADGTLALQLLPGFDETEDAEFPVIGFASAFGAFATFQGFADNQGYAFDLLTEAEAFALAVLTRGSEPAPDAAPAAAHDPGLRLQPMADGSLTLHYGEPGADGTFSPQSAREPSDFEYSLDLETWHPVDAILLENTPGTLRLQRPEGARALFIRARK